MGVSVAVTPISLFSLEHRQRKSFATTVVPELSDGLFLALHVNMNSILFIPEGAMKHGNPRLLCLSAAWTDVLAAMPPPMASETSRNTNRIICDRRIQKISGCYSKKGIITAIHASYTTGNNTDTMRDRCLEVSLQDSYISIYSE